MVWFHVVFVYPAAHKSRSYINIAQISWKLRKRAEGSRTCSHARFPIWIIDVSIRWLFFRHAIFPWQDWFMVETLPLLLQLALLLLLGKSTERPKMNIISQLTHLWQQIFHVKFSIIGNFGLLNTLSQNYFLQGKSDCATLYLRFVNLYEFLVELSVKMGQTVKSAGRVWPAFQIAWNVQWFHNVNA